MEITRLNPAPSRPHLMGGRQPNLSSFRFDINHLSIPGSQPCPADLAISTPRPDLVAGPYPLNRNEPPAGGDQLTLRHAYLVKHGTCGVVAPADVSPVSPFEEDH